MIRSALGKVAWVGRTASMVFGLALVLALVIGAASTAWSATGGNFILGKANVATTPSILKASIAKPALTLVNQSTEAAATALNISVASGKAPLKVNAAAGTATNLSADELDGKNSTAFYAAGSKVADSSHADQADSAADAQNAAALQGKTAGEFANATHPHSGDEITTGTVGEARIDGTLARDSEIMPTVKANDGEGSGLDADSLDGLDSMQVKPLTASVNGLGFDVRGWGVVTAAKLSTGTYEVQFNRTVSGCNRIAGIGKPLSSYRNPNFPDVEMGGEAATFNTISATNKIGVLTRDSVGNLADRSFHLAVFC